MSIGSSTNSSDDGVFGWYRYIQDFTGDFALTWLKSLSNGRERVWEPFAGSGTTLVAAKLLGIPSTGYDMNPFMVDVAQVKLRWDVDAEHLKSAAQRAQAASREHLEVEPESPVKGRWDEYDNELQQASDARYPADTKIRRWLSPRVLARLQALLVAVEDNDPATRDFLRVAAASLMVPASNMAFRPNICYESRPTLDYPVSASFLDRANQMADDLRELPHGQSASAEAILGDARSEGPSGADLIFTSPPYPNDMEYVHQTRLELALLEYTSGQAALTRIKKQMISSSVKLVYRENEWQKRAGLEVDSVREVCSAIDDTLVGKNWGWNASDMTAQYFGGMRAVLENWRNRLPTNGIAAVVIGDSAFNGVKVATDVLLADAASLHGFACEDIEVFRTRWNTKHSIELRESVVVLRRR